MPYWVFGYGSLIWKPPPHAVEQRNGYVKGVVRRFAQSSIDHRGIPEAPGRVVTVIDATEWHRLAGSEPGLDEDYVWGVAYRIQEDKEDEVRAYLEHREKNGYSQHHVHVYGYQEDKEEIVVEDCTIWIGRLDNPAFVGYEPLNSLSRTIYERVGPSGPNKVNTETARYGLGAEDDQDYVYKLAESVRKLYPHVVDDYLFELEAAVRAHETVPGL